jgi:hypothetical protein
MFAAAGVVKLGVRGLKRGTLKWRGSGGMVDLRYVSLCLGTCAIYVLKFVALGVLMGIYIMLRLYAGGQGSARLLTSEVTSTCTSLRSGTLHKGHLTVGGNGPWWGYG